jgi:hypothetical protein
MTIPINGEIVDMDKAKAQEALRVFKELAKTAGCATDLHNAFFGIGGRFGAMFPTRAEREAFAETPEYAEIVRLRAAVRERETANP